MATILTPLMDNLVEDINELLEINIQAKKRITLNKSEQRRIRNILSKIKNEISAVKKESMDLQ